MKESKHPGTFDPRSPIATMAASISLNKGCIQLNPSVLVLDLLQHQGIADRQNQCQT